MDKAKIWPVWLEKIEIAKLGQHNICKIYPKHLQTKPLSENFGK
jgi:hypothetical protein